MSAERPTGWGGVQVAQPKVEDVRAAAERIHGHVVRTPLVPMAESGCLLKPETLQPIGSFKLRGALNWAAQLTPEERQRGFSTHSAGNTALALGAAARAFDVPARSLLPDRTPQSKIDAIRAAGVTPVVVSFDELLDFVFSAGWNDEPYAYLNPWTDPHMIEGSGTIALEILDDCPNVEAVYIPVGGGGLMAGLGGTVKALNPDIRVVAVQPEGCPALHANLAAGHPEWIESTPTICDTALPVIIDELYPLLSAIVDDVVVVSDDDVRHALRAVAEETKLIAEAAGALAVAGAMADSSRPGQSVCILSGASIGIDEYTQLLQV